MRRSPGTKLSCDSSVIPAFRITCGEFWPKRIELFSAARLWRSRNLNFDAVGKNRVKRAKFRFL
jgi:hypothetical protein